MKKKRYRMLALLLLCATVISVCLVSCRTQGGGESEKETPVLPTHIITEKYAGYDFGGHNFTIMGMESGTWWYSHFMASSFNEIWYDSDSAEPLESAIYTRNRRTEALLNIKISPLWVKNAEESAEKLRTALQTGYTDFDLMLSSMVECMRAAQEGHAANLLNIETLDLKNEWWDQGFIEAFTLFHDRVYALAGHINVFDDMGVYMLMFNKDLIAEMGMDSPYDLVKNNKWTLDTLEAMAKKATFDTGNSQMGPEDSWGLWVGTGGNMLFTGYQKPMTVLNADGIPELALEREDYVTAAAKLYESIFETTICYDHSAETEERDAMFADNRLLFYGIMTCQLNRYRDMETEFGIVPMPKLSEEQSNYSGSVNQHFYSTYVVPSFSPDVNRTGIVLEVMSGYSTDTVYHTTFDTLLGYDSKLLRDNNSKEMLDIIFSTKQYDYDLLELGYIRRVYSTMCDWGSFMYESVLNTYKRGANASLRKIIYSFEDLP